MTQANKTDQSVRVGDFTYSKKHSGGGSQSASQTGSVMMSLGLFVFTMDTAMYDKFQRKTKFLLGKKQAMGLGPSYQYGGLADDAITLTGVLSPPITGGPEQLEDLRKMGLKGRSWNLVDGSGKDLGAWFIEDIEETGSHHDAKGRARKTEFALSLKLAPDLKALGNLRDSA